MSEKNILVLKDITHVYHGKKVLDISALSIERGQIYSLVGPNGSGKTTLLLVMSLILRPTTGEISFKGDTIHHDYKSVLAIRKFMTMVLQSPYLFHMSVAQNIGYGLKARGIPKKDREIKIREALDLVGLPGFEKRKAREISGGETQLVALARALTLDPEIIFLDEPTANVDSRHIHQFEKVILKINKERGTTVVMTTHNLSQAYRLTVRVFSLFEGSIVRSTMYNLFSGKIRKAGEGIFFDSGKMCLWISPGTCDSEATHITIDPEDIIVSREPFTSSARNRFEGIITQIIDQGGKIFLEIRSHEIFNVLITEKSLTEMGLTIGSPVYLTFKASSVHLL
ncbi:MAG: ABC transporter ATP-binding protein [bacterium]